MLYDSFRHERRVCGDVCRGPSQYPRCRAYDQCYYFHILDLKIIDIWADLFRDARNQGMIYEVSTRCRSCITKWTKDVTQTYLFTYMTHTLTMTLPFLLTTCIWRQNKNKYLFEIVPLEMFKLCKKYWVDQPTKTLRNTYPNVNIKLRCIQIPFGGKRRFSILCSLYQTDVVRVFEIPYRKPSMRLSSIMKKIQYAKWKGRPILPS